MSQPVGVVAGPWWQPSGGAPGRVGECLWPPSSGQNVPVQQGAWAQLAPNSPIRGTSKTKAVRNAIGPRTPRIVSQTTSLDAPQAQAVVQDDHQSATRRGI